jgi:YD repeat-containing protein
MVAIIGGGGTALGLSNSSAATLGRDGVGGNAAIGRSGEQAYVNSATGNLVIQDRDELVKSSGLDVEVLRTYNSQGLMDDDNGDNWRLGVNRKLAFGPLGTSITRTNEDGAGELYAYDLLQNRYVSSDGSGAFDTIVQSGRQWVWTDGTTRHVDIYDVNGRLLESRDADGKSTQYGYTGNLLTSITDASNQITYLDYTGNNLSKVRVVSNGLTQTQVRYGYDGSNRLTSVTVDLSPADNAIADGKTYVTNYTYDGTSKRVASITQSDGTAVSFTYQQQWSGSWVVKTQTVTDTVGSRTTTFNYSLTLFGGTQCDVTDPLGLTTTYVNDITGSLTSVLSPDIGNGRLETDYAYDIWGNVTGVTKDPGGLNRTTTSEYDAQGNPVTTYDAMGNTVTRVYSATNQLLAETQYNVADPDGGGLFGLLFQPSGPMTTRYVYDANNHLRFTISADGRVTENRYVNGNRDSTRVYASALYDVSALSNTTVLSESQMSAWAALQDQTKTELTEYKYDFRAQLSSMTAWSATSATGVGTGTPSTTNYVYDQRGNLLQKVDPRGVATTADATDYVTNYVYDGLNRLTGTTEWVAAGLTRTTLTQYDDAGNRTISTFANGLVSTTTFSRAGDLTSVVNTGPAAANLGTTSYKYDANGRLRMSTDPSGVRQFYLYDAAGRKTADVDGNGSLTEYVYDKTSLLIKTVRYAAPLSAATLASMVDASGNPTNVALPTLRANAGTSPAQDRITRNVYNRTGQLVFSINEAGAVTEQVYDGAGRVTDVIQHATPVSIARTTGQLLPSDVQLMLLIPNADDRRTRFFYDSDGHQVGQLDAAGYLTESTYNAAGHLTRTLAYATATPAAQRLTGTLAQLRPALDNETTVTPEQDIAQYFFYDGQGQLVGTLDGEGFLTETVYDVDGHQSQVIRYATPSIYTATATLNSLRPAAGGKQTTSYAYDGLGRVTQQTNVEGTVTTYAYDQAGNVVSSTTALGTSEARTAMSRYDAMGRVTQALTPEGATKLVAGLTAAQIEAVWTQYSTRYAYDLAGRRVSATDQYGQRTVYYYDNDGRLNFTVNALGEVQEKRYNALGQLTTEIGYTNRLTPIVTAALTGGLVTTANIAQLRPTADTAHDATTSYTYALTGQVASRVTTAGGSITSVYDVFGEERNRYTAVDATRTRRTEYTYDVLGQVTLARDDADGLNLKTSQVYDAFGRVKQTTDANGNVSRIEYDRLGRTVATVDALNARSTTTYDAFSRVLTQRDALGNPTSYAYNDATRSMVMTTPEGISVTTVHNRDGQAFTVTAAGDTTTYTYDVNGRLTGTSDNLGTLESRSYDLAGRQVTQTDARGSVTSFSYDAANRVLTKSINSGTLTLTTVYGYDGQGRVTKVTEPNGRITDTQYDGEGRVMLITVDAAGQNISTGYTYDREGRTLTVTQGQGGATPRVTQYDYDAAGRRIDEIDDPAGFKLKTQYRYDANGNMTRRIDAIGQSTWYVFDADNRQRYSVNALGEVTETTYDANGRVIGTRGYINKVSTTGFGDVLTTVATTTNPLDRIERTVYDKDGRDVYSIDGVGTVTERTFDAAGRVTRSRTYAKQVAAGTYTTLAAVATALQAAGNSTTALSANDRVNWTAYDLRGRSTFTIDGMGGVTRYQYDGNGNVVSKTAFYKAHATTDPTDEASLIAWANTAANQTPARDRTTSYWYDALDRQRYMLDAEGYLHESAYDEAARTRTDILYVNKQTGITAGMAVTSVDAAIAKSATLDQKVVYLSDKAGRIIQRTDGEGYITKYTYDTSGNCIKTEQALDQAATSWAVQLCYYDAANRETATLSAEGYLTTLTLDGIGQIKTKTVYDQKVSAPATGAPTPLPGDTGRATNYTYDAAGRVLTETNALNIVTRYQYDAHGNRLQMDEAFGSGDVRTTTYLYDAADRMTQYTSAVGTPQALLVKLDLDAFGNVKMRREAAGTVGVERDYSTSYDAANRVSSETDALGVVTNTVRNALGDVESRTAAVGTADARSEIFLYDKLGRLIARTDALGNTTVRYTYDAAGNIASSRNPNATPLITSNDTYYVNFRKRLGVKDATGAGKLVANLTASDIVTLVNATTTVYTYDRNNHVAKATDPLGVSTTYEYDGAGNRKTQTEASGIAGQQRKTSYTYDKDNRLLTQTDPLGGVTTYTYDVLGKQRTVIDANGALTTNNYDAIGRLLNTLQNVTGAPGGGIKSANAYDLRGNVLSSTVSYIDGSDARTSTFLYDAMDHQIQSTDGEGFSTKITYDLFGNQTSITHGLYLLTSGQPGYDAAKAARVGVVSSGFSYDAGDRMLTMTDGVGNITKYTYDNVGNRTSTTEASNGLFNTTARKTTYVYDAANRLKSVLTPVGGETDYDYDAAGNKIGEQQLQSGTGVGEFSTQVWINLQFEYDGKDQLITEIDPYGTRTEHYYDAVGNAVETRYAAGTTDQRSQRMAYDLNDRKTADIDAYGNATSYAYDKLGNRIKVTDALNHVARYYYDEAARLTMMADPERNLTTYQYDSSGNRTTERSYMTPNATAIADGTVPVPVASAATDRIVTYQYDKANQVISQTDADGSRTDYVYDSSGKKIKQSDFANLAVPRVTNYVYDAAGRLTQFTDVDGTVSAFTYDGANNRMSEKITNSNDPNPVRLTRYTYDLNNRRITETFDPDGLNIVHATGYDYVGNVIGRGDGFVEFNNDFSADPLVHGELFTYDLNNRLISDSVGSLDQSDTGEFISGVGLLDGYTRIKLITTYGYDRVGNRTSMTAPNGNGPSAQNPAAYTTNYDYDKNNRLIQIRQPAVEVYTWNADTGTASDVASARPTTQTVYDAVGNAVQTIDANGNKSTNYYDGNGHMVRQITGDNVLSKYVFDAVGNLTQTTMYMVRLDASAQNPAVLAQPVSIDPKDTRITDYAYDKAGRLLKTTLPQIDVTTLTGAATNSPTSTTALNVRLTEVHNRDAYGNEVETIDRAGNRTLSYYDIKGRKVATVDSMGYLVEWDYDAQDNKLAERVYLQALASPGTLTATTRPSPPSGAIARTDNVYDAASRLVKTLSPSVSVYDPATRTSSQVRPTTTYSYDNAGNVLNKTIGAGTPQAITEAYFYDAANRRIAVIDASRVVNWFVYDKNGNQVVQARSYGQVPPAFNDSALDLASTDSIVRHNIKLAAEFTISNELNFSGVDTSKSEIKVFAYDAQNHVTQEQDIGSQATGDERIKNYKYDASGNRTYLSEGDSVTQYATKTQYDEVNRVKAITTPDGNGTKFTYDAAGNRLTVFTGVTSGAVPAVATTITTGLQTQVVNATVSSNVTVNWKVTGNAVRTWVVYDTATHANVAAYPKQTPKHVSLDGNASALLPAPTGGAKLYFRVVTQDATGAISWTPEQTVSMPPRLSSVVVSQSSATTLTLKVRFDAAVATPTLAYGAPGALSTTISFGAQQADGSYVATINGVSNPNALDYAIKWNDTTGNPYATAEAKFVTPADRAFVLTDLARTEVAVGGTTKYKITGYLLASADYASTFQLVQVQWRPAGSSVGYSYANASPTAQGGGVMYAFTLGQDAPVAAGNYEVVFSGVRADGSVVYLDATQVNIGPTPIDQGDLTASWKIPAVGSNQLAIVAGQLTTTKIQGGRLLTAVPLTGTSFPISYLVNYTDSVATAHTVAVTSSATTGATTLTVKATLNTTEANNIGPGGLRVAWKAASPDATFTTSQSVPVTATAGVYQTTLPSLPAGQYDLKLYYVDKQGNDVIVEWRRVNTGTATQSFAGNSQTVVASETGSLTSDTQGFHVVPGLFSGNVDPSILAGTLSIKAVLSGSPGGSARQDGSSAGYITTSEYDALNYKTAGLDDQGVLNSYGVDTYGNAVQIQQHGKDTGRIITTYAAYDQRSRKTADFGAPMQVSGTSFLQRPVTRYGYDALDDMTSQVEANGRQSTYTYNALGTLTGEFSADTGTITHLLDQFQRETARRDGRGGESQKYYDLQGRLIKEVDELNNTTLYGYDYFGRMTSKTDARGASTANANDYTTLYGYDNFDEVTSVVQAQAWHLANDTATIYANERTSMGLTTADGAELQSRYTATYAYDSRGNRISATTKVAANSTVTTRTEQDDYDAMNRVIAHHLKSGSTDQVTQTNYDIYGNVILQVDEMGRARNAVYGGYGRIDQDIDQDDTVTNYVYDEFGHETQEADPNDTTNGKLINKIYDDAGFLRTIDDPRTKTRTDYTYDIAGRRATEKVVQNGVLVRDITYTRDLQGRVTSWRDAVTGANELTEYDLNGNRTRVSTQPGWVPFGQPAIAATARHVDHVYTFNAANQLTREVDATTNTVMADYTYDAAGNRQTWTDYPNNTKWTYTIDANGRVAVATGVSPITGTTTTTTAQNWAYDTVGNVLSYTEKVNGTLTKSTTSLYNLNDLAETVIDSEKKDGQSTLSTTTTVTHFDDSQRAKDMSLTNSDGQFDYSYAYYGDGREKSVTGKGGRAKGTSTSTYDVNKMRTTVDRGLGDGMETNAISTFTADNEGHLLSQTDNAATNATSDDVKTQYLYSEGNPIGSLTRKANKDTLSLDADNYALFQTPSDSYPGGNSTYQVNAGDTLQSVASALYGNPSLWFVLADANGLNGSETLEEGSNLKVPNTIQTGTITADNHVVYKEGDVVGSTLPNLKTPPPKKKSKCGAIVAIIATVIVAVVVSVVTWGLAAPAAAAASAAVISAVGVTVATGVGLVAAAAVGAAIAVAGSFLRQGILMLAGLQKKFSWKDLAVDAAVGSFTGAAAGVGGIASAAQEAGTLSELGSISAKVAGAALMASGNAVEQKLKDGKITNWTGLAVSAIGGYTATSGAISNAAEGIEGAVQATSVLTKVVNGVATASRYVAPWANLAETYAHNHKLTKQDWISAVAGTLSEATNDTVDFGEENFSEVAETQAARLAVNSAVTGGIALADGGAARDYFTNSVGTAIGSVIDGGLLRGGFAKLRSKANDAYVASRQMQQSEQATAAGSGLSSTMASREDTSRLLTADELGVSLGAPGEFQLNIDSSLFDTSGFAPDEDRAIVIRKGDTLEGRTGIHDPHVLDQIAQYNGLASRHETPQGTLYIPGNLDGIQVSEAVEQRGAALGRAYAQRQADKRQQAAELAAPAYEYSDQSPPISINNEGVNDWMSAPTVEPVPDNVVATSPVEEEAVLSQYYHATGQWVSQNVMTPTVMGTAQAVGGFFEATTGSALVVAGGTTSMFGVGIPVAAVGALLVAHGADQMSTGVLTVGRQEFQSSNLSNGLQAMGVERQTADLLDMGVGFGLGVGAARIAMAPRLAAPLLVENAAEETSTVFRVQGGEPPLASRRHITLDAEGNPKINETTLNISIGDPAHAEYFLSKRPGADITSFEIPKWMSDFIHEEAIPQVNYKSNPLNQGGLAPKIVDPTTPGRSYELPSVWAKWLEEVAIPGSGKITKGGTP